MRRLRLGGVRRALVVAPHPDDEAIGAWGVVRHLRRRGVAVRILVIADGAASHPNSITWPKRRLVTERRRETRGAMRRLGVGAGACEFLGLPDGAVADAPAHTIARAVRRAGADLILLPSAEDHHPDHRAVATAAAGARTPGARRFAYLVWGGGQRARGPVEGWPLGTAQGGKRAAIRQYRTQTGAIRDDPQGFSIAPHELRAFSRPNEWFRAL